LNGDHLLIIVIHLRLVLDNTCDFYKIALYAYFVNGQCAC
jgi:hypothetical protein